MDRSRTAAAAVLFAGALAYSPFGCSPSLTAPRESVRVSGTLQDVVETAPSAEPEAAPTPNAPSASSDKPGKSATPGPFVVEIDTQASEIVVFGFRGFLGPEQQQEACAETKIAIDQATKP